MNKLLKALSVALTLTTIIPAQGMARLPRFISFARTALASRITPMRAAMQKPSFSFARYRKPLAVATAGILGTLGAQRSDATLIAEKEQEIKAGCEQELAELNYPIRAHVHSTGTINGPALDLGNNEVAICAHNVSLSAQFSSERINFKASSFMHKKPAPESEHYNLLFFTALLKRHGNEFKKCVNTLPQSNEEPLCKALFNSLDHLHPNSNQAQSFSKKPDWTMETIDASIEQNAMPIKAQEFVKMKVPGFKKLYQKLGGMPDKSSEQVLDIYADFNMETGKETEI